LLQVIDAATARLFVTSFVAYKVPSIVLAFKMAIKRGVRLSMLLEPSDSEGGGISFDVISKMKSELPGARILTWTKKDAKFSGGSVHAKIAVADEALCFVSSANLTGHAMERNMEAGVLIKGGNVPRDLQHHLEALETANVIALV
jgi:phosphatidylserine/phosphatidylglycerophosphate/cardiolipin synthase-like enzyme